MGQLLAGAASAGLGFIFTTPEVCAQPSQLSLDSVPVVQESGRSLKVRFDGVPGTYRIYASTDSTRWQFLGSAQIPDGAAAGVFEDPDAGTFQYRFYKVRRVDGQSGEETEELPVTAIQVARAEAWEKGSIPAVFFISRNAVTSGPLTVGLLAEGSATPGQDYVAVPQSVTIPAGQSNIKLYVYPIDDQDPEGTEEIRIAIQGREYYSISEASEASAWIRDDEMPLLAGSTDRINGDGWGQSDDSGTGGRDSRSTATGALVTINLSHTQVNEGSSELPYITLTREGGSSGELPVHLSVSGDAVTGRHVGQIPSTVSFSRDNNVLSIPVFVIDDAVHESHRKLVVQVDSGAGYVVRNPAGVQLEILENDLRPAPQIFVDAGPDRHSVGGQWIAMEGVVRINGVPWNPANEANRMQVPVVDAGPDKTGVVGEPVQLNGSVTLTIVPIQTAMAPSGTTDKNAFL